MLYAEVIGIGSTEQTTISNYSWTTIRNHKRILYTFLSRCPYTIQTYTTAMTSVSMLVFKAGYNRHQQAAAELILSAAGEKRTSNAIARSIPLR